MKVLFLDDDHNRLIVARQHFKDHEYFEAETAKQAIVHLKYQSPFDLVHLDHDLGGVFLPSDEKSGYAVAEFISMLPKEKLPKQVVIHSYNPAGVANMRAALERIVPLRVEPFNPDRWKQK